MTGIMRIDVAAVEGLLTASGRDGWFVEQLKWLEEYPETCRKPPPVKWILREQEEEEAALLGQGGKLGNNAGTHVGRETSRSSIGTARGTSVLEANVASQWSTQRGARTAAHGGPGESGHAGTTIAEEVLQEGFVQPRSDGFGRGQRVHRDPGRRASDLCDASIRLGAWRMDHHEESCTDRHDVQQERAQTTRGLASASRAAVTVDRHGDEQVVPAAQQGPPTKKVAMLGDPIPCGLREVDMSSSSQGLNFHRHREICCIVFTSDC